MGILNTLLRAVTWWDGQTLNTQLYTARKGVKVGEDDQGNVFYTSKDGKRRWVIYNGEVEASRISPDWHGWLHHTFDELPTDKPLVHKDWEKPQAAQSAAQSSDKDVQAETRHAPSSPKRVEQPAAPPRYPHR